MLVVRIELWPFGDEDAKLTLGVGYIANDGTGNHYTGNYNFKLMKSPEYAKTPGVWKKGRVERFPRVSHGPWDLLYRALRASVGYRNGGE